ncbi:tail assembly chaperone [Bacillus gobiensis]|uniref:tail assembly chaperone n=1 Tax=Bacillus gobiensis TaxID=1441095 RepID=UPI003D1C6933
MAFLTIGDKQYEAKTSFKFDRIADKKYSSEGELTGLENIYQGLMGYKIKSLAAFWDCGTAHYGKREQPSIESIEDTIERIIEEDEKEIEKMFKDAFKALDESGFFRLQLKEYWKNIDMLEQLAEDEKEIKQAQMAKDMFTEKRKELLV